MILKHNSHGDRKLMIGIGLQQHCYEATTMIKTAAITNTATTNLEFNYAAIVGKGME